MHWIHICILNFWQFFFFLVISVSNVGLPCWLPVVKKSACQCRRHGLNPWIRKIPWRRKWQLTPIFLPGKSHGKSTGGLQSWCSVALLCLTLCNPMNCRTPGFPVLHNLPELAQTHVHWVSDAIQPSHPLSSLSPAFNISQLQSKGLQKESDMT